MFEGVGPLGRRQFLRVFGAAAAASAAGGLVAACSSDSSSGGSSGAPISVGLVAPKSGPYALVGAEIERGFQLYLDTNGTMLGNHPVDLKIVDEGATVDSAQAAVKSLLDQQVSAIAGVANPDALPAIAQAMETAKVPLVSLNAAPGTLTSAVWVWRVSSVVGEAGRALAGRARKDGTQAYLLYDTSSVGVAEAEAFRTAFTDAGGDIVGESQGTTSLSNRLQSARFDGATTIFAAYSGADAVTVLDAYRASGSTIKLLGPGMLTETIDLSKITLPSRVYTSSFYAYDLDNTQNTRFVTTYNDKYKAQPTTYALSAFDGASVLDKALAIAGGATRGAELNQAFSQLGQIDSPRGTWTFNINRSPQQKWYLRQLGMDGMIPGNLLAADLQVLG